MPLLPILLLYCCTVTSVTNFVLSFSRLVYCYSLMMWPIKRNSQWTHGNMHVAYCKAYGICLLRRLREVCQEESNYDPNAVFNKRSGTFLMFTEEERQNLPNSDSTNYFTGNISLDYAGMDYGVLAPADVCRNFDSWPAYLQFGSRAWRRITRREVLNEWTKQLHLRNVYSEDLLGYIWQENQQFPMSILSFDDTDNRSHLPLLSTPMLHELEWHDKVEKEIWPMSERADLKTESLRSLQRDREKQLSHTQAAIESIIQIEVNDVDIYLCSLMVDELITKVQGKHHLHVQYDNYLFLTCFVLFRKTLQFS